MRSSSPALAVLLALAASAAVQAQANPVNDTGIVFCRDHASGADSNTTAASNCTELPNHGAQDARYGRDAAAIKEVLVTSTGKGFDYVKISHSGAELPASAAPGNGPDDWGCTYDKHTGLLWEIKVDEPGHLRSMNHTYTWYFSGNTHGGPGVADTVGAGGVCLTDGRCDTEKFVADVNAAGLCGKNDWRVPTIKELYNLVDRGRESPAIHPSFFPNTPS
ncbi:MAG: DUF1566 domain-containing protein, partial [Comamonadaceae bacterium]|nr:DUF1566 domain-containing protein [Comamonadaceae bacterium]